MVQLTQHCLYMDISGYMKHSYILSVTRNLCTKHQDKEKRLTPHTVLNQGISKFVGTAIQQTFDHCFHFDYSFLSLTHFKCVWITHNIVNTWPRYTRYMHVSCTKTDFASFRPKKLTVLYSCLCSLIKNSSSLKAERPGKWVRIQPHAQQQARFGLRSQQMATTVLDIICLATTDPKDLHHAYSGCLNWV